MIRWESWIADTAGDIDYTRVYALTAVGLAFIAGIVVIISMVLEMMGHTFSNQSMMIGTGALIIPLTGGKVANAIKNRAGKATPVAEPEPEPAPIPGHIPPPPASDVTP